MLKRILLFIWHEFLYGGHLQSLGSSGIVLACLVLLQLKIRWDILVVAYLISYPIYLFNRYKEITIDKITNPERTKHFRSYYKFMPFLLVLSSVLLVIFCLVYSNTTGMFVSIVMYLFGLLYTTTFKPLTKKIPSMKNIYVALAFAKLVWLIPFYYGLNINKYVTPLIILTTFIFCKGFLMQILLDVKDINSDKLVKLKTIPIILGKEASLRLILILSIVLLTGFSFINTTGLYKFPAVIYLSLLVLPYNLYSLYLAKKNRYSAYLFSGGEFIFWGISMAIAGVVIKL